MNGHLGGAVDRYGGRDLPAQPDDTQILHNEGIHTAQGGLTDQGDHIGHFPVGNQGIQGQMHRNTPDMAVLDRLRQSLRGEVFGTLPGIEGAAAQIYGIGAVLHSRPKGFHGAGGR